MTSGRTSLQWTWQTRATCFASIAAASPPANVMWPVSNSSPTSSPVARHQRIDVGGRLDVRAHVVVVREAHAVRERVAAERGQALGVRVPLSRRVKKRGRL